MDLFVGIFDVFLQCFDGCYVGFDVGNVVISFVFGVLDIVEVDFYVIFVFGQFLVFGQCIVGYFEYCGSQYGYM